VVAPEPLCSLIVSVPFTSGSSLQLLLSALRRLPLDSFSSLYIGILAATRPRHRQAFGHIVSVPFTSGSSLQRRCRNRGREWGGSFSSLYIGILAATLPHGMGTVGRKVSVPFTSGSSLQRESNKNNRFVLRFQFPLHRDPRCNSLSQAVTAAHKCFSSLYIGILAATVKSFI